MSFREFAATTTANERETPPRWRYYLQAPLVWGEGRGRGSHPGASSPTFYTWRYD